MSGWLLRLVRAVLFTAGFVGFAITTLISAARVWDPIKDVVVAYTDYVVLSLASSATAVFAMAYWFFVPASEAAATPQRLMGSMAGSWPPNEHTHFHSLEYEVRFAKPADADGTFAVAERGFSDGIILPFQRHQEWSADGLKRVRVLTERPMGSTDRGQIIAYYSVLPLPRATYEELIQEKITEKDLVPAKLSSWDSPDLHVIYICAIVRIKEKDFAGALMLRDLARYVRVLSNSTRANLIAAWTIDRKSTGFATDVGMKIVGRPKAFANSAFCEGEPLREGSATLSNPLLARLTTRAFEEVYEPMP